MQREFDNQVQEKSFPCFNTAVDGWQYNPNSEHNKMDHNEIMIAASDYTLTYFPINSIYTKY